MGEMSMMVMERTKRTTTTTTSESAPSSMWECHLGDKKRGERRRLVVITTFWPRRWRKWRCIITARAPGRLTESSENTADRVRNSSAGLLLRPAVQIFRTGGRLSSFLCRAAKVLHDMGDRLAASLPVSPVSGIAHDVTNTFGQFGMAGDGS